LDADAYRNFKSFRQDLAMLDRYPDQVVVSRGRSRLTYTMADNQLIVPLTVNGRPANYMLDSGSSVCSIGAAEAKRIGLNVHRKAIPLDTFSTDDHDAGGVAIADDLVIGNFHLRNVMFVVDPDQDEEGMPGIIGLPVLLALDTLRWSSDGVIEFGFPSSPRSLRDADMCLSNSLLLTRAETGNRGLISILDTGSYITSLLPRFAQEYPAVMKNRLQVGEREVGNGVTDPEATTLPDMAVRVGGLRTILSPAVVLSKEYMEDTRDTTAWLGMDLLGQARAATLDFTAMKLTLEGVDAPAGAVVGACRIPPGFACVPGFQCSIKTDSDTPCLLDRMPVDPLPGNQIDADDEAEKHCLLPSNVECSAGKLCRAVFDSDESCHVEMENPMAPSVTEISSAIPLTAPAPAAIPAKPSPEARELMSRMLKYDSLDLSPARDYIYLEEKEERMIGKDGAIEDTSTETREVMNLYDAEYARLIRKNGKDLPANKARAEQARFDKAVDKRAHETPEAKARREENERKEAAENLVCEDEFLKSFDFRTSGSEVLNGRAAWIVEAEPVPHAAPRCRTLRQLDKFHLKLWIDQDEYRTARFEADNIAPVNFAAVLVRLPTGGLHVVFEAKRHDDGVWLESRLQAKMNVRALLFAVVRQEIVWTYSGYRKFHSDSRLTPVKEP
ncbi:MAG TPA: retropepsin-like aspartic protease, partial [Bryobacteraceae bacterium]